MDPDEVTTDQTIWQDILKLQLDGIMMHIILFEQFDIIGLEGYKCLHLKEARDEFHKYLHVVDDYIDIYNAIPISINVVTPTVSIQGATKEEKMINGMEIYKNWEHEVCTKLKLYQKQLSESSEHVDHLINSVHEELKCINLMCNDLLDGKYEELDEWLVKTCKCKGCCI